MIMIGMEEDAQGLLDCLVNDPVKDIIIFESFDTIMDNFEDLSGRLCPDPTTESPSPAPTYAGYECYCMGDPHCKDFDGKYEAHKTIGDFVFYKGEKLGIHLRTGKSIRDDVEK